ncbi:MAG: deoxyribodipyrimidine photo-lyase [Gammaproteobacteria bacterium]|nr:deoxyribodipyrimidine photo-lyase [Gammaproteobacteria bacterium]
MNKAIVWFRRDLRIGDNPALRHAVDNFDQVLLVYVHAPGEEGDWAPGAASRWWLHHSLTAHDSKLRERGGKLVVRKGESLKTLTQLAKEFSADAIFWNRLYDPATTKRDKKVKKSLEDAGIEARSFQANLLFEPWTISTREDNPYRVFTPFWKACLQRAEPDESLASVRALREPSEYPASIKIAELELLPVIDWDEGMEAQWTPGEDGAGDRLDRFLEKAVDDYDSARDLPAVEGVSRLSPHLHFGEISPRQIWHAVKGMSTAARSEKGAATFLKEIGWREFAHHVLYHFPKTPDEPLYEKYAAFPWRERHGKLLKAWQKGQTGFPIVDAGMRQLWTTGWMHNRVRMIVASLLVKNLRIPWQKGASWFWDTLVDADLASNTLGWQWSAGCGADAAPYFRIFNPVTQSTRFDAAGEYLRKWVPEIAALPDKWLHEPWNAPEDVCEEAGFRSGRDYPEPIVDLKESREDALAALKAIKGS